MKKSKKGLSTLRVTTNELLKFRNSMYALGFRKMSAEEILAEIVEKERVKPKRANVNNALQAQYRCTLPNGYAVSVLTTLIDTNFNVSGSAWVHIVDTATDKKVLTREFYRRKAGGLLQHLVAYAQVAKNIAVNRSRSIDLVQVSETEYQWQTKGFKKKDPFILSYYFYDLDLTQRRYITAHEKSRNAYLRRTQGRVRRQRTFQSQW